MVQIFSFWGIGIGTVALVSSLVHYSSFRPKLKWDVPIHFNVFGYPDNSTAKENFVIYPALTAILGLTTAVIDALIPGITGRAILPSMGASLALILISQHYAALISMGATDHIPKSVFIPMLVVTLVAVAVTTVLAIVYAPRESQSK